MRFEELLPRFRRGVKITRQEWIQEEYHPKYIAIVEDTIMSFDGEEYWIYDLGYDDIFAEDWITYTEGGEVYRDGQALFHTPDGRTFTDAGEADKHIQQLWMQKEEED